MAMSWVLTARSQRQPRFDLYVERRGEGRAGGGRFAGTRWGMFGRLIFRDDERARARNPAGPAGRADFALSGLASRHAHLVLAGVTGDVLDGASRRRAVLSLGAGVGWQHRF